MLHFIVMSDIHVVKILIHFRIIMMMIILNYDGNRFNKGNIIDDYNRNNKSCEVIVMDTMSIKRIIMKSKGIMIIVVK